jgi:hypothetical protein
METMKALVGISVDSSLFTTSRMLVAITALRDYDHITFLIADDLQVYNELAKIVGDHDQLVTASWNRRRNSLSERKKWLSRVRLQFQDWPTSQKWRIVGVRDVADHRSWEILRAIRLLYILDPKFKNDVIAQARSFVATRVQHLSNSDIFEQLSIEYILEEVALNLRVRIIGAIEDEFYLGNIVSVLPRIYQGEYMKSAVELAKGIKESQHHKSFRFFDWSDEKGWIASATGVELGVRDRVVTFPGAPGRQRKR